MAKQNRFHSQDLAARSFDKDSAAGMLYQVGLQPLVSVPTVTGTVTGVRE